MRFLKKAVRQHGVPENINADKSGANASGRKAFNDEHLTDIELGQAKYLNKIVDR
ncbi:hypothetical protein [Oligoflexus sp.]|uniref:hypothetical protein n=1 Tax=Oligoflexus sp. TaxID=1971216 RepID=UPI0039C95227